MGCREGHRVGLVYRLTNLLPAMNPKPRFYGHSSTEYIGPEDLILFHLFDTLSSRRIRSTTME